MLMANLFSSGAPHIHFFPSSAMILLVVWSANGNCSALIFEASSKVNILNDDTYRWDCAAVFSKIEQSGY